MELQGGPAHGGRERLSRVVTGASRRLHRRAKPLVGNLERFWQNPSLAGDGHEIRVSNPTRQYMHVDVSGDPGASGSADIHAHVDGIRSVDLAQNPF